MQANLDIFLNFLPAYTFSINSVAIFVSLLYDGFGFQNNPEIISQIN